MTSLERFGTVAFDWQLMHEMIFLGRLDLDKDGHLIKVFDVGVAELGLWYAMVPEVYREDVLEIIKRITGDYIGQKADQQTLHRMIADIHGVIARDLEPR